MAEKTFFEDQPAKNAGSWAFSPPMKTWPAWPSSACSPCSTAGRKRPGSPCRDGETVRMHKDIGLVSQVFTPHNLAPLSGHYAIGHTRYSTTGSSVARNAQPFLIETRYGPLAVAHNGNLVNTADLRRDLLQRGVGLSSSSDSEVITMMLAGAEGDTWEERIRSHDAALARRVLAGDPHPRGRVRRARSVGFPAAVASGCCPAAGTRPPRKPARCARSAARRSARCKPGEIDHA